MEVLEYSPGRLASLLPHPGADANKYTRGKLVVVGGSARYPGAACLAALAAQRMGAGYIEVACAPESVAAVRSFRPSLVVDSWIGLDFAGFPASSARHPIAYAVGPGFDAADGACAQLALAALEDAAAPVLIDGGAIGALATGAGMAAFRARAERGRCTVVTPHGGEAARLAHAAGEDPTADAPSLCLALAQAYACTVVLKGPDTFVSDGMDVVAMRRGTPALAKAGTGDVLAGMVGALLAQGMGALDAGVLGSSLHAEAARAAAGDLTDICVTPEDVVCAIPRAVLATEAAPSR